MANLNIENMNKLTKAELVKKLDTMIKADADRNKQLSLDLTFSETNEEKQSKKEKQAKKDFIKRMTNGRWVSDEKYRQHLADINRKMKVP